MMHLNIRSIQQNFLNFSSYHSTLSNAFDIIGLSETWMTDSNAEMIQLDTYTLQSNHRRTRHGGGVAIFLKNNIQYNNIM